MALANASCAFAGVQLPVWDRSAAGWVNDLIPLREYAPFDGLDWYRQADLAHLNLPSPHLLPNAEVGYLRWPVGASKWAAANFVVTEAKLNQIRAAVTDANLPQPLLVWDAATGRSAVSTNLYLLPPRPLLVGQPQTADGPLWVVTLVDDRYFWWQRPLTISAAPPTWASLFMQVGLALGVTITAPAVPAAYLQPTGRWVVSNVPACLVLDAAAEAVGMKVVRALDGTVSLQDWGTAKAASDANYAAYTTPAVAGGGTLRGGGRVASADISRSTAARVAVVFGQSVSGVPTAGQYTVYETRSLLPAVSGYYGGIAGMLTATARFTADAYAEVSAGGSPSNLAALSALAAQAASDWYGWRLADKDAAFAGIVPWQQDAYAAQVRWCYERADVTTRVTREPFFDQNVYGTHFTPGITTVVQGGADAGFWARLTDKTGSPPSYSWVKVADSLGSPLAWSDGVVSGFPGSFPAYEVNGIDLPTDEDEIAPGAPPLVVWLRKGSGDYYLIDQEPRWEFVAKTGDVVSGFYPANLLRYDQDTGSVVVVESCWLIDFNT